MYGFYYYDITSIIIMGISLVITLCAQFYVSGSYKKYKRVKNKTGLSGFETARKILDANGLENVHIVETSGELTDHYDPKRKVIRLSKEIFNGTTIASSSVAAHEVGHAIQDKVGYGFMRVRSFILPVVNLSTKLGYFAIVIGFIFGLLDLAYIGIFLLAAMLVFQLITLPVEFNASKRAREELARLNLLETSEISGTRSMLNAAAMTYVASLITTILELLRLFLIARDRD